VSFLGRGFWATLAALDVPWLLWCLRRILPTPGRRWKAPPRVGIAYTVDELAQKVCGYDIVLLVVRQAGDCCR
jgi:hypothetical protein